MKKIMIFVFAFLLMIVSLNVNGADNTGMVGCWANSTDAFGDNDITLVNAVDTQSSCKIGSCMDFDGSGDYAYIPSHSSLGMTDEVSWTLWFYKDQTAPLTTGIFGGKQNTYRATWSMWTYHTVPSDCYAEINRASILGNGIQCGGSGTLPNGQWLHLALTYDGTNTIVYKNGNVLVNSTEISGAMTPVNFNVYMMSFQSAGRYINGRLDEIKLFNRTLTPADIVEDYNTGSGLPCSDFLAGLDLDVITPAPNQRTNNQTNVTYNITSPINTSVTCDLIVDSIVNATDNFSLVENIEQQKTLPITWSNGVHNYLVYCYDGGIAGTSGNRVFDFDDKEPYIQSGSPSLLNDTVFTGSTMDIIGNVTDDKLWKVNRTIFYPNNTVFYNNYSGILPNLSSYSWYDTFDITGEIDGNWSMMIEGTDPHSKKKFKDADKITKDNPNKKITFEFNDTVTPTDIIEFTLIDGDVLGNFVSMNTTKFTDRYTFEILFDNVIANSSTMVFGLYSDKHIDYVNWSNYTGHFIINDEYWVDFEGESGVITVAEVDENNFNITFVNAEEKQTFNFDSLGGLNDAEITIEFQVDTCIPDWYCSGYASCSINDTQSCNAVTDNNTCGETYTGNYMEFPAVPCDYCVPDWILSDTWGECSNITFLQFKDYFDNNTCGEPATQPASVNRTCGFSEFSYGDSTDFSQVVDPNNVSNAVIETVSGYIKWANPINVSGTDLSSNIFITDDILNVVTANLHSSLNSQAEVSFYVSGRNSPYNACEKGFLLLYSPDYYSDVRKLLKDYLDGKPKIYLMANKNDIGSDCKDPTVCQNIRCENNMLTFDAQHFSIYGTLVFYDENDIAPAIINTLGKFLISISTFIVIIVLFLLFTWGRKIVIKK